VSLCSLCWLIRRSSNSVLEFSSARIVYDSRSTDSFLHYYKELFIEKIIYEIVCLFVCFESHEQYFSYQATVTITGDGVANIDLHICMPSTHGFQQ
jgi:hypothetical protein